MLITRKPAAPLALFVEHLWFSERGALPHRRERSLPTGCADIVIPLLEGQDILRYGSEDDAGARRLRGPIVQGAHDRHSVRGVEGPSRVAGVHFKPGGAAALFGSLCAELRNRTELLEDLWGPAARHLQEQLALAPTPHDALALLEHLLAQRLRATAPDPIIANALSSFERSPADALIEPIQQSTGLSTAQFIRRFEANVGLTPKRYTRVRRFNALLPTLVRCGPRDWAQVAVDGGYYDQSHLIHEFRRLAGMTPSSYLPVQADQPTHVAIR
ncbi:AraC family transcriptional regulator [Piscinibacter terrae]|uniref:AraC family transcriptional regulator n=1 Tax=Piscinibacter terrae TaxID=2496871 RepID=A0A3N7HX74_9BURK|nr:helix-turn-helix domain-containing protein [Albitalea terrae]RQP26046.1 AraC family transcriptional regulator [Albitalea terrae]